MDELNHAIEVFVKGFCFTRSFTWPYVPTPQPIGWLLQDSPAKKSDPRTIEWVVRGEHHAPEAVDRLIRTQSAGGRFALSLISGQQNDGLKHAYKQLGWRLRTTEPFMIQRLQQLPQAKPQVNVAIERVLTAELAHRLAKAARSRQILPQHLSGGSQEHALRQYTAHIGDEIVGWVRSIVVNDATWCSNMFVREPWRRQGIGGALLARMLQDDRETGAKIAVLTASHTGAKLYATAGYQQIGLLSLFAPPRAPSKRQGIRPQK